MEVANHVHTYNVSLKWNIDNNQGTMMSGANEQFSFGPPPQFGGSEKLWSPEQLLCASVAACYTTTFFHFATLLNIEVADFQISATVDFEKKANGFEATVLLIKPVIKFKSKIEKEILDNLLAKAKKYCFVSNSIKGVVSVECVIF